MQLLACLTCSECTRPAAWANGSVAALARHRRLPPSAAQVAPAPPIATNRLTPAAYTNAAQFPRAWGCDFNFRFCLSLTDRQVCEGGGTGVIPTLRAGINVLL